MWCNTGFAKEIYFKDIKIGDKISKYFNSDQISKYYILSSEKTPKGELVFGKNKQYSFIGILKKENVFNEDYDAFQIYYENSTKKIVSISGIDKVSTKNECLKKRQNTVSAYQAANRITTLFNKEEDRHTFPDGMKDYYINFYGKKTLFVFSCYIYPNDMVEHSFTIYENNYNDYIFKKFNEE